MMKRILLLSITLGILSYLGLYLYFYNAQENRFKSSVLPNDYKFHFETEFEEFNLSATGGGLINAILFKSDSSSGVVFFLKGNGGTLEKWGQLAPMFLMQNLDVLFVDYRQHGKSTGEITQDNFYSDAQTVYDFLKTRYKEEEINLIGYSLGTTIATHLSTNNNPKQTILIDPKVQFSAKVFDQFFPLFPSVNRFHFSTEQDLKRDESTINVIVGAESDLFADAQKLKRHLKEKDKYIEIEGANHQTILGSLSFKKVIFELLKSE